MADVPQRPERHPKSHLISFPPFSSCILIHRPPLFWIDFCCSPHHRLLIHERESFSGLLGSILVARKKTFTEKFG